MLTGNLAKTSLKVVIVTAAMFLVQSAPAFAHSETGVAGGLVSGLLHPVFGIDHLVAMVAVGLWGAQLGRPAIWVLPIAFPVVMAIGGLLGVVGVELPLVEAFIAGSAIVLGLLVAGSIRLPLALAGLLVAVFAIFHGHAHGEELPKAVNPLAYGVGFVTSTGLLHLAGIIIGTLVAWSWGAIIVRIAGLAVAGVGAYFMADWAGLIA